MSNPAKRKAAILQSNYIPWKGYFDLINMVDIFILYDDMQYTRRDWRNRNRIKTPDGAKYLTIPVKAGGNYLAKIREIEIGDSEWAVKHWETIRRNYSRAPFFAQYRDRFEELYLECRQTSLSLINKHFITAICGLLGIGTDISVSMDYELVEGRTERLVNLCRQVGAGVYCTGPSARDYIDERLFDDAGIELEHIDYSGYPEYQQLYPPFDHQVSIIDLLFNTGPDAHRFMKSFGYRS